MALSITPTSVRADDSVSPITVDGGLWPLLVVKLPRCATMQELEAYLAQRVSYLDRCEPHVCIIDAREVHMPAACLRQRYTEWLREHEAQLRRWTLGTAYIIQSPAVQMMVSVMRHFARLTMPFMVTGTQQPAAAWSAERFQEVGLSQAATRIRTYYALPAS
ncbi:hypothetical protein [Archangium lansingense]|uniref:STAS/SEC14 domain-containing protein n=2 Tax=Archangium lansingense TaxID=2995310 RepID=A0ABT4AN60_9BACT|nr:hypothetical protein [Archangium lansinium]MCY1083116.1 hypothetical protein [Archangium lansinium]